MVVVAIFFVLFTISNRPEIIVELWPLPYTLNLPLYLLLLVSAFFGFIAGVIITFFSAKSKSRKTIIVEDNWFLESHFTKGRNLGFRNNLSTVLSSLVDNTVFSIFAWILLNPEPIDLYNVIMIYILGTYILRIVIALLDTPFIYLAKYFIKNTDV